MGNETFFLNKTINEGLQALHADTDDLTSDITCLTNILHAVAEAGNLTPEQFKAAMKSALSHELDESKKERTMLTEGDNTVKFLTDTVHYAEIQLDDPSTHTNNGHPKTKATVWIGLNRSYHDIINDRTRTPRFIAGDEVTSVFFERADYYEAANGKAPFLQFNCSRCGSGLSLNKCNGCGHEFKDDKFRSGGAPALSKEVIELIKAKQTEFFDLENEELTNV